MSLIFETDIHDLKIHIFIVHHSSLVGTDCKSFILFIGVSHSQYYCMKTYLILKTGNYLRINITSIKIILKRKGEDIPLRILIFEK